METRSATSAPPSFLESRRGKLVLALMYAVAFMDLLDASIVNVALPVIRTDLHFSVQNLQWVATRTCSPTVGSYCSAAAWLICSDGGACSLPGRRSLESRRSCAVWLEAKGC